MSLEEWKTVTDMVANAAILVAGGWAVYTYHGGQRLERTKWLKELYEKFYEKPDLKRVRDLIDVGSDSQLAKYVSTEPREFTDYLNFFEFIGFLYTEKQISEKEIKGLFDYYLKSLRDRPRVLEYVGNTSNGYEMLLMMLNKFYS
jgi:hypothetical protein